MDSNLPITIFEAYKETNDLSILFYTSFIVFVVVSNCLNRFQ